MTHLKFISVSPQRRCSFCWQRGYRLSRELWPVSYSSSSASALAPSCLSLFSSFFHHTIEGVRARVSQPSFYNSLPVCSIMTFRRKIGKSCKLRVGPLWLCDPFNFPLSLSLPSTWNFSSFTYNFLLFRLVRFQPFFPFF